MSSGFRTLPDYLKAQIDALGAVRFVFGSARPHSADLKLRWTDALDLEQIEEDAWLGVPPVSTGRWSKWNITGRVIVRKDLPKTTRSWTIEAPDFQGGGTHPVDFTRGAYQKQRLYGRQIEASVVRMDEPRDSLVGSVMLELQAPFDDALESDYLYAASLSRTWFGTATIFALNEAGVPQIPDHKFAWEFLPDGSREQIREALERKLGQGVRLGEIDVMVDRLVRVNSLHPTARLVGSTGLQRYIGYQFGDDFVAFENPRLGNALYILQGDWAALSQLSRSELLTSRVGEFDRIIHSANWFDKLRLAVYDYRHH